MNYYASTFILYELSSPFLNFHWFFDKLNLTGSKRQLVNGILLLATFFGCRLCWGTYQSLRVYQDMWFAVHHTPGATYGKTESAIHDELMQYNDVEVLPLWLGITYLASNLVLNALNFYWFAKMIDALRKRFVPAEKAEKPKLAMTGENGRVKIETDETTVRRRNVPLPEADIVPIP